MVKLKGEREKVFESLKLLLKPILHRMFTKYNLKKNLKKKGVVVVNTQVTQETVNF